MTADGPGGFARLQQERSPVRVFDLVEEGDGLVDDPALRAKMGVASRHRAVTEFSYDVLAERLGTALGALA